MRPIIYLAIAISLLLTACNNEPSLQKFFVESAEKKDFVSLDVSSNIIDADKAKLSPEQKKAIESFDKMNIVAFKATDGNQKEYQAEKDKLTTILKDKKYQELIRVGSGSDGASIKFVGTEEKVDEFIFYANQKQSGFAVIRVTGDNMSPNDVMQMLTVLQQANVDLEQLKPLQNLMK